MAKNKAPIQLASMGRVGIAADGDSINFSFTAQDGREYRFSCPHEAVDFTLLRRRPRPLAL